jgi:hypothetical protein
VLADQHAAGLEKRGFMESYLSSNMDNFPVVDDDTGSHAGSYLNSDKIRQKLIRAGMTETEFKKRWVQHQQDSLLRKAEPIMFYQLYLASQSAHKSNISEGVFADAEQRIGFAVANENRLPVTELFPWRDSDNVNLGDLAYAVGRASTVQLKRFKHLCYMFELFYAVGINPDDNITQNPGCEWQIRFFGK